MEATYIRKLNVSYLQLSDTDTETERDICGEQMLLQNRIYGFLPISLLSMDEKRIYQYNITGRQALDGLLEHKQIDEQMLQGLLAAISSMAERMENYLLAQAGLLLLPEYIFRDYETGEFWFCYYPGKLLENEYTFQRLTEYLLTKIDHKEEQVVRLAYQVYEEALKEGYSLSGIRDKIIFFKEEEGRMQEKETESIEEPETAEPLKEHTNPVVSKLQKRYILLVEKFFKAKNLVGTAAVIKKLPLKRKKAVKIEPIVFEPEAEEVKTGHPTTLLVAKTGEAEGILKYVGNNQLPDFKIEELPFLVGSDISCGGVLAKKTISRMHACITKTENTYYIEDLNSSNGTKVDGEILSYKEKTALKSNQIIEFADEKFRFI